MELFEYPVLFKRAPDGGYVVTCRDLPQLITQGDTLGEVEVASVDAMEEVFAAYMQRNLPFPAPSPAQPGERLVSPPAAMVAKATLYVAMREQAGACPAP
jgi:antitoxin HicB